MKLLTVICLANSVAAGAIKANATAPKNSLDVIKGVMTELDGKLENLDNQIRCFTDDASQVEKAAAEVIQTLQNGRATIDGQPGLSFGQTLNLPKMVDMLKDRGKSLLKDLMAKKAAIESGNFCGIVCQQTMVINDCSRALINATIFKVPNVCRNIAKSMSAPLLDAMKETQDSFNETNCVNKGTTPLPTTIAEAQPSTSSATI